MRVVAGFGFTNIQSFIDTYGLDTYTSLLAHALAEEDILYEEKKWFFAFFRSLFWNLGTQIMTSNGAEIPKSEQFKCPEDFVDNNKSMESGDPDDIRARLMSLVR